MRRGMSATLRAAVLTALAVAAPARADDPYDRYTPAVAAARAAVAAGRTDRTPLAGSGFRHRAFTELPGDGAVLVGFEVFLGRFVDREVVHAVIPLYVTGRGDVAGLPRGWADEARAVRHRVRGTPRRVTVKARPGYAVAGLDVRAGLMIDGLAVRFARVAGAALDPADAYAGDWVGGSGGSRVTLDTRGALPIGVFGDEDDRYCRGIGLITIQTDRPAPAAKPPLPEIRNGPPKPGPRRPLGPPAPPPDEADVLDGLRPLFDGGDGDDDVAAAPARRRGPAKPGVAPAAPAGGGHPMMYALIAAVTVAAFLIFGLTALVRVTAPPLVVRPTGPLAAGEEVVVPVRATFFPRLAAVLIDGVVIGLGGALLIPVVTALDIRPGMDVSALLQGLPPETAAAAAGALDLSVAFGLGVSIVSWALVVWEALTGATPGRLLAGLRVRAAGGGPAALYQLILRAAARNSQAVVAGLGTALAAHYPPLSLACGPASLVCGLVTFVGCFLVLAPARQALHDLLAGTAVYWAGSVE
jgi:uncharacterized RDD family membrane protein YckC